MNFISFEKTPKKKDVIDKFIEPVPGSSIYDNRSVDQQGKFLRLLRRELNELNFSIDSGKSSSKIFGDKKAEITSNKREKILIEYENIINDLLKNEEGNYVIYVGLLKVKEWMHASEKRWNEEFFTPFKQMGNKELFFDGTEASLVDEQSEKIDSLHREYKTAKNIIDNTDNHILENSSNFFMKHVDEMAIIKKYFNNIKNKNGVNLRNYLTKEFLHFQKNNSEQDYYDFLYFISEENQNSLVKEFNFNPKE